ncbi:MAG: SDR family NAD(P)-dependent oxidoreductase [Pseudomonadota bacterium]
MAQGIDSGTIVMTGATAGIGLTAVHVLSANDRKRLIVGARSPQTAKTVLGDEVRVLSLDLASLESVSAFCERVREFSPIQSLVLNAGLNARSTRMTEDGFDLTFQANYLSHFAIVRDLWRDLTDDAHITITSSGTHDPAEKTPPPPPKHADARLLAFPRNDPGRDRLGGRAAARSYTASKLCCTMLSLELASRRPAGTTISFDPGLVPGTRLTREFPSFLVKLLLPIMSRTMPPDRTSTLPASAGALARLMVGSSSVGENGDYVAMRGGHPIVVPPSEMARNESLRGRLWDDSNALLDEVSNEKIVA